MYTNWVLLGVSLLFCGLLFAWILRVEKRLQDLEKR